MSKDLDSDIAYELNAKDFLKAREYSLTGIQVITQWSDSLKTNSKILELACGGGKPVFFELGSSCDLRVFEKIGLAISELRLYWSWLAYW